MYLNPNMRSEFIQKLLNLDSGVVTGFLLDSIWCRTQHAGPSSQCKYPYKIFDRTA